ncbi:hypothetical protein AOL_s00091g71 [Orbilia oligospora ATCC 24927]|uniref:Uncharacterized protein n=1 Tax=Arthrobotrys oligospora (strain ATCC 24927 / CBS 115.81 / DSM 1491) TaxID=756982 RepID=G1XI19_ARTOA|nr:hypothetical protein AOL_s00091g71 [Orbilia oligospora ATCC 24927]EGX47250.1 hypothetical protein AOL_s00091g71 [Orbilia oligospora ATCC 24927]
MRAKVQNVLQCWLYDAFYQHIPADSLKLRNLSKKFAKLYDQKRSKAQRKYRVPPTPSDPAVKKLFPHWSLWHRDGPPPATSAIQNAPKPQAVTVPQIQATQSTVQSEILRPAQGPSQIQGLEAFTMDAATAYHTRAIEIDSKITGQPSTRPEIQIEGGWKMSTKKLINTSTQLFDRPPDSDANDHTPAEPIISPAPLFTSDTIRVDPSIDDAPASSLQFATFAKLQSESLKLNFRSDEELDDDIVFLNTNTPFTTFICGLQGSGKSHSLSVIMENCVIQNPAVGILHRPLAGVVFYFSPFTPLDVGKPCEIAYLAVPSFSPTTSAPPQQNCTRKVTILISRSNLSNMQQVYRKIPSVTVYPLLLKASQLTTKTMLYPMSIQEDNTALYLQIITRILKNMAANNSFNYEKFKAQLALESFTSAQ